MVAPDSMTPGIPPLPEGSGPVGLLLGRDLIFTSKITGTGRELGYRIMVAGNVALATAMIEQWRPAVVFVDLSAGDLVTYPAIVSYRKVAGPDCRFVAFGSHVDTVALESAKAAGCDPVLPRSRFTAELPSLMKQVFDQGPAGSSGSGPTPDL